MKITPGMLVRVVGLVNVYRVVSVRQPNREAREYFPHVTLAAHGSAMQTVIRDIPAFNILPLEK